MACISYASQMDPDDRIDALERIVIGAVGLTTRALAEAAPGTELTFPQWRALLIIGEDPPGARVGQVARRVGVTLPATGRLLRRLERRGLVAMAVDGQDRRATRAQLTSKGEVTRSAILAYRRAALRVIADRMPAIDPDRPDTAIDALAEQLGSFT
jgi:DNA-binding MarR family transcriptional regulator